MSISGSAGGWSTGRSGSRPPGRRAGRERRAAVSARAGSVRAWRPGRFRRPTATTGPGGVRRSGGGEGLPARRPREGATRTLRTGEERGAGGTAAGSVRGRMLSAGPPSIPHSIPHRMPHRIPHSIPHSSSPCRPRGCSSRRRRRSSAGGRGTGACSPARRPATSRRGAARQAARRTSVPRPRLRRRRGRRGRRGCPSARRRRRGGTCAVSACGRTMAPTAPRRSKRAAVQAEAATEAAAEAAVEGAREAAMEAAMEVALARSRRRPTSGRSLRRGASRRASRRTTTCRTSVASRATCAAAAGTRWLPRCHARAAGTRVASRPPAGLRRAGRLARARRCGSSTSRTA